MGERKERNRIGACICIALVIISILIIAGIAICRQISYRRSVADIKVSNTEEIIIPGVKGEYEFLFLTDMHIAIKTRQEIGGLGDADDRMLAFVNAEGVKSSEQFSQWITYANHNKVDAVLMNGDMIDYYSDANEAYLCETIQGLEMPYLFTLGNHELYSPWEEEITADADIYGLFKEKNPAFQMVEYDEFLICSIDNNEYQVNPEALEGMKQAIKIGKPIILLAHVPFYTEHISDLKQASINSWGQPLIIGEGARDTTAVTREFMEMAFSEESPVVAVLAGDNHFYFKGQLTEKVTQVVVDPSFAGNGTIIKVKGK